MLKIHFHWSSIHHLNAQLIKMSLITFNKSWFLYNSITFMDPNLLCDVHLICTKRNVILLWLGWYSLLDCYYSKKKENCWIGHLWFDYFRIVSDFHCSGKFWASIKNGWTLEWMFWMCIRWLQLYARFEFFERYPMYWGYNHSIYFTICPIP